jgi:hypothetical protein
MSTGTATEPSVEEVSLKDIIRTLLSLIYEESHLEINESEFQSLRNEGVNGYNFLMLSNELLKDCGIRAGQRASLIELISNLNSQSKLHHNIV